MGIEAEDEALFWIARESTGSLRDAFTLFDQVASFSGGHIRTEIIREKLGLVGLERLNELAEACVEADATRGFELFDRILSSGVAIEQFVIDLAGYYRSLLLLKNSVSRESLLGYPAERFSAKVLGGLSAAQIEQALELLLDCYRDIKYSVSPRFELETVISKLSWLKNWIPAAELRAAVEEARKALGVGGSGRPLAGREPPAAEVPVRTAGPDTGLNPVTSLSEEFRRRMARHEAAREAPQAAGRQAAIPQAAGPPAGDEDLPMWSTLNHAANGAANNGGGTGEEAPLDPLAQRVLRVFRGTIVSGDKGGTGEYKPF
jgi:DNA polymerase-3 subunit gamma/tau